MQRKVDLCHEIRSRITDKENNVVDIFLPNSRATQETLVGRVKRSKRRCRRTEKELLRRKNRSSAALWRQNDWTCRVTKWTQNPEVDLNLFRSNQNCKLKATENFSSLSNRTFCVSGICVIINNRDFYKITGDPRSKSLPKREGTDIDCSKNQSMFLFIGLCDNSGKCRSLPLSKLEKK